MNETTARILSAATGLFAQRGYEGASIRAICEAAGTNINAISYHFGGKQALYQAILATMGGQQLASAKRILGHAPTDMRDFEVRLTLFAEELLSAYLAEPDVLMICVTELHQGFRNCDGETVANVLLQPREIMLAFFRQAQAADLLRGDLNLGILAGTILERVSNQVLYAESIPSTFGDSVASPEYRHEWAQEVITLLLYGAAPRPPEGDA